jgi:uncharacterized membrane protein YfcA
VVANVSNNIGLVPGALSGAFGYRTKLEGQRERVIALGTASVLGGALGAVLLLVLPASWFKGIVPVFIVIALVLVVFQPQLSERLERRDAERPAHGGLATGLGVFGSGVYGGYFGAAQGILLLAILGLSLREDLQRITGLKIVLVMLVNLVAGILFLFLADVAWLPVALIAAGSVVGGQLGARYGQRLAPGALRAVIVVVGLAAIARLTLW